MRTFFLFTLLLNAFVSFGQLDTFSEYISSSQWNTLARWKNKDDKLDSNGVITRKSHYNPVTIFQFALVNYELFQRTGEEVYLENFRTQVEVYALDDSRYITINDTMVGYPYQYNYGSLKAPWFSGMSQGYAISVLLRYYDLTKDKNVLNLIVKVKNLMLTMVPMGTLNYSDDGCVWIEEYPDKKKKQVLNGFFISYVGLYEYCKAFPNDSEAAEILEGCYTSISSKNLQYQRNNWLNYSSTQGSCTNGYLKFQVIEMKHLFELTQDDYFSRQMAIWAYFTHGKKIRNSFNGGNIYFGKPMSYVGRMSGKTISHDISNLEWIHKNKIDSVWLNGEVITQDHSLIDTDLSSRTTLGEKRNTVEFFFSELPLNHNLSLEINDFKRVRFYAYNDQTNKWKRIRLKERYEDSVNIFNFSNISTRRVKLKFKNKVGDDVSDLEVIDDKRYEDWVHVLFHRFRSIELEEDLILNLTYEQSDCKDLYLFYKYAETVEELRGQKWDADNYFSGNNSSVRLRKGFYEVLITTMISGPHPTIVMGEELFRVLQNNSAQ